jgi:hypothetical protein
MSGKKLHPELVIPSLAETAMSEVKNRTELYTHYIMAHYHATRNLAPGCDNKDLLAWYELNMPGKLAAITKVRMR